LLIAQGLADAVVQPGTSLDERLVAWTAAHFANEAQASGCTRKPF
jgi:hypothetical protein